MTNEIAILLILPASILVASILLPNAWVNARVVFFRQIVTWIAGIQAAIASLLIAVLGIGWLTAIEAVFFHLPSGFPITLSILYDGVAGLMFALVSFVGWVICRYSLRYLDGEANQGRYFRWTAFTLGTVSLMVISGNLLMFVAMWIATSMGLHQLLLHYGDRPKAKRAAWTKFVISRVGDLALIGALIVIGRVFGTWEFHELFASAESIESTPLSLNVAALLLVIGAVTKSAQFPFHTWLPQTMETPTPVSALMHAGIVNAGGYLIIRTSPVVTLAPWALTILAIIGGFTACFAALVMLTQTSVKKSLAYSTIAQMGFMLLQCGLGAYSAAMLHILAHSLYKAHAFLSSGSVIAERVTVTAKPPLVHSVDSVTAIRLALVGLVMVAALGTSLTMFGVNPVTKSGGLLLGGVLCLAMTYWIGQVMRSGSRTLLVRAISIAIGLCVVYATSYYVVDQTVAASLPTASEPGLLGVVTALLACGFIGLFSLQFLISSGRISAVVARWYVHASNGFYLESTLRRLFAPLTGF